MEQEVPPVWGIPSSLLNLIDRFLNGSPSIYDSMSYICVVSLFIVVMSIHVRQMNNARRLKALEEKFKENSANGWTAMDEDSGY